MRSQEQVMEFAEEWIQAWNSHDLQRILSHYDDEFEMSSPFIVQVAGEPSGKLRGKAAVGEYWRKGLERSPDLHFDLLEVLVGAGSICLYYKSAKGMRVAEWLEFGSDGKIIQAAAHYAS